MSNKEISVADFADYFGLPKNSEVVGGHELYNDNDGNYFVVYLKHDNSVSKVTVRMTTHPMYSFNWLKFYNAELYDEANEIYRSVNKDIGGGRITHPYVDCEVILKGSRKAPNGIQLTVTGYIPSHRKGRYLVNEQIIVTDGEESWNVSVGCIKEVVKGQPIVVILK